MRNVLKEKLSPVLQRIFHWYYKKPRKYQYGEIRIWVEPGVFPPHFTLSTKVFLEFIETLNLERKSVLELGCGSGVIALLSAQKGGLVTASDINKTALNALKRSSAENSLPLTTVYSNLMDNISSTFDFIFINPPYYPKNPDGIEENAWYCGENFEYFQDLFPQLKNQLPKSKIYMILSQDCELNKIQEIAKRSDLIFKLKHKRKVALEENYIFEIALSK